MSLQRHRLILSLLSGREVTMMPRPRLLFKITVKIQDGMLVILIGKPSSS